MQSFEMDGEKRRVVVTSRMEAVREELKDEQKPVFDLLRMGKSVAETAASAGVGRATVYRWIKNDPAFRAAYNEWHEEMEESSRGRLMMLTDLAAEAVEKALRSGDVKAALQLLKAMGVMRKRSEAVNDQDCNRMVDEEFRKSGMM